MKEKQIENQILMYLYIKRIFAWKNQSTGIYDPKKKIFRKPMNRFHINGVADILGILPDGKLLAIEVKTPTNKPTECQKAFLEKAKELGAIAFVARSILDVDENLYSYFKREA